MRLNIEVGQDFKKILGIFNLSGVQRIEQKLNFVEAH